MIRAQFLALTLAVLGGCDSSAVTLTRALFDSKLMGQDLYAVPYPNDVRRRANGTVDLAHLGQGLSPLVQRYVDVVAQGKLSGGGFGPNAGAFFRFSGPIDSACLPASPTRTLAPDAAVAWINIDPRSANHGKRTPVMLRYRAAPGKYIGAHSLAVVPVTGIPLEPDTVYAVLLLDHLCGEHGAPLQPAPDLARVLAPDPPAEGAALKALHSAYAPLRTYIARQGLTGVVNAAVLTTGHPVELAASARKVVHGLPAPAVQELVLARQTSTYYELRGTYSAPFFQAGTLPFSQPAHGGQIKTDASGEPLVARTESLRFALTVPRATPPAGGWPVVLYAHGTGGSYRSFINSGVASALAEVKDDAGQVISRMAVVSIDQNLHGPRSPSAAVETAFFNFLNPAASVHNIVQAGIDDFSLLRMVLGLKQEWVPWSRASGKTGGVNFKPQLRMDPSRAYFMGHSQGGLTGPVFLAHEPGIAGAVLSGAGGGAVLSLMHKKKPVNIGAMLQSLLSDEMPLDSFHPLMNLIQQMSEQAETLNYGRTLIRHATARVPAKHILITQGIVDGYTPNATTDALALAVGVPLVAPVRRAIPTLSLAGLSLTAAPLAGNISAGKAKITGALLQYEAVPVSPSRACKQDSDCSRGDYCQQGSCLNDGHFVVFQHQQAKRQYSRFLATMARDGVPTVVSAVK